MDPPAPEEFNDFAHTGDPVHSSDITIAQMNLPCQLYRSFAAFMLWWEQQSTNFREREVQVIVFNGVNHFMATAPADPGTQRLPYRLSDTEGQTLKRLPNSESLKFKRSRPEAKVIDLVSPSRPQHGYNGNARLMTTEQRAFFDLRTAPLSYIRRINALRASPDLASVQGFILVDGTPHEVRTSDLQRYVAVNLLNTRLFIWSLNAFSCYRTLETGWLANLHMRAYSNHLQESTEALQQRILVLPPEFAVACETDFHGTSIKNAHRFVHSQVNFYLTNFVCMS
jgi:hypothetical protein